MEPIKKIRSHLDPRSALTFPLLTNSVHVEHFQTNRVFRWNRNSPHVRRFCPSKLSSVYRWIPVARSVVIRRRRYRRRNLLVYIDTRSATGLDIASPELAVVVGQRFGHL